VLEAAVYKMDPEFISKYVIDEIKDMIAVKNPYV